MIYVSDIAEELERLAPPELAEPWDNVGLMTGDMEQAVKNIFVCLDVTSENVEQAAAFGADLIISHHPLIFSPVKRIVESDVSGGILRRLITKNISVYSMHTNFDKADGGMNDLLAKKLGLSQVRKYTSEECLDESGKSCDAIGRIGTLPSPMSMGDYTEQVKEALNCFSLRSIGEADEQVQTVALCSGAGGDFIYTAYRAGADVYVTSDVRHHEAQLAQELGMNLIDAGHFETENIICEFLSGYLLDKFEDVNVRTSAAIPYFA